MATILVKGISEETLKRLKRLKLELDCDTWAELLDKLSQTDQRVALTKKEVSGLRHGAVEYIELANKISKKWHGSPSVLEEIRAGRRHD